MRYDNRITSKLQTIAVRLWFFVLRLGNKYVLYFSLEAAILVGIFSKMPTKIAASKKLLKGLPSARNHLCNALIIKELILIKNQVNAYKNIQDSSYLYFQSFPSFIGVDLYAHPFHIN